MSSALIKGAAGIFTGLPGPAMRARGAIRIVDGRIAEMGNLDLLPGEELIDASDCVIYPGLISTHHHLFQSVLKGVRAGIDSPLLSWLRVVPYSSTRRRCALRHASGSSSSCSREPPLLPIITISSRRTIASILPT